jgi:hypothetical protein
MQVCSKPLPSTPMLVTLNFQSTRTVDPWGKPFIHEDTVRALQGALLERYDAVDAARQRKRGVNHRAHERVLRSFPSKDHLPTITLPPWRWVSSCCTSRGQDGITSWHSSDRDPTECVRERTTESRSTPVSHRAHRFGESVWRVPRFTFIHDVMGCVGGKPRPRL